MGNYDCATKICHNADFVDWKATAPVDIDMTTFTTHQLWDTKT